MMASDLFDCVIADQPTYLVPARLLARVLTNDVPANLVVNPHCWFSWNGDAPVHMAAHLPLPACFRSDMDMLWVRDPVARWVRPFWIGPRFRDAISSLEPGQPVSELPRGVVSRLLRAGVLVNPKREDTRRSRWASKRSHWSRQFRSIGYVPATGLLHPYHIGSLRRYYRRLLRTGGMKLGDSGSPLRYIAHNEPIAVFYHRQLTSFVSDIAGIPVKRSYVYVASYQGGAELPEHTDRIQCEYSLTLLIDHSPETSGESPWPLYLNTPQGQIPVYQSIGDALVYRGRRIPHYRTRLPDAMTSTSIFFHYVDADFTGPLD